MAIRKNETLRLLRAGTPAIGTWLQLHSVHATRLLVAQGCFQWLLVDFEHTPVDYTTASTIFSCISDTSAGALTPLARVAVGSVEQIKQALDCGAQGIIVPMVNTAQEAQLAVRCARFPPDGERGGGGLAPHLGFGVGRPEYIASVNPEILVAIQIETLEGVRNIRSILEVKGIDAIFIGPNDLHLSLGLPARFWSAEPAFQQAIGEVLAACREAGVPVGTLCREAASVQQRIGDGFTFLGLGSDAHFMLTFAGEQFGQLRGIPEPPETWCNMVNLAALRERKA
jgi:4-hydroxy-2-oxoheptanedioate aldolase